MTSTKHLELEVEGPIAFLSLCRPDKLNVLTLATLEALDRACGELEQRREVRAVVVHSTNPKAFCAGADIAEWGALPAVDMWRLSTRLGHRVLDRLARLPQPTIAAIDGLALGGGLELALACDIRIAGDAARFGMPETTVGAVPGWGGTLRLPTVVGVPQAKRLLFSGAMIDVAEALRIGLIQEWVHSDSALAQARTMAAQIVRNAPFAVRMIKQLLDSPHGGLPAETLAAGFAASLEDGREGVQAFKDKRKPVFTDA
ncbi:enoyl-CoA hydratase/isomerase family protein [Variovorax terrae]|uniref:Enoyl-CoA hydratase-related protein n=1 Tax=Variovorax terrae TaxID=2923278 RepID=A0A9X1W590_9BURK|nr:enoyl-CoA hydratase-related protein [Variovorax terrae]MCJ0765953.1 enoyl-CoA hydratase-related protein [Variovorax terrae]